MKSGQNSAAPSPQTRPRVTYTATRPPAMIWPALPTLKPFWKVATPVTRPWLAVALPLQFILVHDKASVMLMPSPTRSVRALHNPTGPATSAKQQREAKTCNLHGDASGRGDGAIKRGTWYGPGGGGGLDHASQLAFASTVQVGATAHIAICGLHVACCSSSDSSTPNEPSARAPNVHRTPTAPPYLK